ncbi:MAG: LVIVD repeat-containing protein [Candidatus Thorarchaeota archaeon]
MKPIESTKFISIPIMLSLLILLGASSSPLNIQKASGYSWVFDEDFTTTSYMDFANTTVWGWEQGSGMVSLPRTFPRIGSVDLDSFSNGFTIKDHYAYIAEENFGLEILDISDPKIPQIKNQLSLNNCVDVVAGSEYLYLTNYYPDITRLSSYFIILNVIDPINPVILGSLAKHPNSTHVTLMGDMVISGDENWIYVLDYILDSGFQLVAYAVTSMNITDPLSPSVSSIYEIPVPMITLSFDNEMFISGNYLYLPDGYNGFSILDISDPTNIDLVVNYTTGWKPIAVSIEHDFAYFVDINHSLQVFDVATPSNPLPITIVTTSPNPHAIWVEDNLAYIAYSYGGLGGLQVFDVHNPSDPVLLSSTSILSDFYSIFKDNRLPDYPHDDYILICGRTLEVFDAVHYESVAVAQSTIIVSTLGSAFFYLVDLTSSVFSILLEENTTVEFYFSPDAGVHWEQANLAGGLAHQFTLLGSQLRWKAILRSTDGEGSPIIGALTFECYIYIEPPYLLSPDDGYSTFNNRPTLEWENLPDASSYYLHLDTSSTFNSSDLFTIWIDEPASSFTLQNDLSPGTWYWRISAIDMDNEINPYTRYSATRSILIDIINQPADVTYIYGSLGHNIAWYPVSSDPASFQVYRDGTWVAGGPWDGNSITIGVDHLPVGLYNYTCTVYELSGKEVSDSVTVTIIKVQDITTSNHFTTLPTTSTTITTSNEPESSTGRTTTNAESGAFPGLYAMIIFLSTYIVYKRKQLRS